MHFSWQQATKYIDGENNFNDVIKAKKAQQETI
jgi:hypothetical protein